ncbi:MAG: hypothetical protein OXI11_08720 [Gammaproteobacteria bacterium]|nr:hypothetical protein [Gammaproteobacteria bacterium]
MATCQFIDHEGSPGFSEYRTANPPAFCPDCDLELWCRYMEWPDDMPECMVCRRPLPGNSKVGRLTCSSTCRNRLARAIKRTSKQSDGEMPPRPKEWGGYFTGGRDALKANVEMLDADAAAYKEREGIP